MRSTGHIVFFISLLLSCGFLNAAEPADEPDRAREFYRSGIELFENGEHSRAADAFREAYNLRPSWKIFFNIGQAEAAAGRFGMAIEAFEQYLVEGRDDVPADRKDYVLKEIQRLRVLVCTVEIKAPSGSIIMVDNVERGTLPSLSRVKVAAGNRHIQAVLDGETIMDRVIRLSGGDQIQLAAGMPAKEEPATEQEETETETESEPEEEAEPGESGELLYTWVALGIGSAAAVTAGILGGVAMSKSSDVRDKCPDNVCPPGMQDDIDEVENLNIATDVMIGVAGAGLAAALILYFVEEASSEDKEGEDTAGLMFNGTGIGIEGRF